MQVATVKPAQYCSLNDVCLTVAEWGTIVQMAGVLVGLLAAAFGLYKAWEELKRLRQQREKDHNDAVTAARLKRTEFLLAQHRRLFDDPALSEVLSYIDADDPTLAKVELWDMKRKFLTFFEEISLLVDSELLDADVAYYMFGYYANCARNGANFNVGINTAEEHWRMFYRFCRNSEAFFDAFRKDLSYIPRIGNGFQFPGDAPDEKDD